MSSQNSKISNKDLLNLGNKFEIYRSQTTCHSNGIPKSYSEELKNQCCNFFRNGISKKILSDYLKIAEGTIYNWNKNFDEINSLSSDTTTEVRELKIVQNNPQKYTSEINKIDTAEIEFISGIILRIPCSKLDINFLKMLGEMT